MEFDVVHRAGVKHPSVDAMYRLGATGADERDLEDDIHVLLLEKKLEETIFLFKICDAMMKIGPMIPSALTIEVGDENQAPTTEELVQQQEMESFFRQKDETAGTTDSAITYQKMDFWCNGLI